MTNNKFTTSDVEITNINSSIGFLMNDNGIQDYTLVIDYKVSIKGISMMITKEVTDKIPNLYQVKQEAIDRLSNINKE